MNKVIIFFCLILLLSGCFKIDKKYESPEYMNLLREIEYEATQELKKKGLYLSGIGGGAIDCIRIVYLGFSYNKSADVSKARGLIVLAVETFLKKINSNEKIRPDLCNYPFAIENVKININFTKNKKINKKTKSKGVTFVTLKKGMIIYEYTNFSEMIFEVIESESYNEAKEKITADSKVTDSSSK